MKVEELKSELKKKLGKRTLKDFWKEHLNDIIGYTYFNIQLNGSFRMDEKVREVIEDYLNEG